jgi:hypothetical protein
MIQRILISLLFLFLLKGHLCAQTENLEDYNVDNIPATLKNRAGAVIRNMETVVDMQTPDNVIQHVKKVVTVLNKNADERAALAIFYNKKHANHQH